VRAAIRRELGWVDLDAEQRRLVDFVTVSAIEAEYAGSADALSVHWFDSTREFPGPDVLLPAGYDAVTDLLAVGLPIASGQVVTEIAWDRAGVQVRTGSGQFQGSRAVLTVPLGVLQSDAIRFTPGLPARTRAAVDELGSGVLNKVVLRFDEVFWDDDVDWIEWIPDGGPPWVEWVNLARPSGQPVLLAFAAADLGRRVDGWADARAVGSAMSVLRTMYGAGVPDPIAHQVTRWGADPLARGSYSYNALGSHPRMRDALAAPIDGRLFLAGEATERDWFGTVHGAYLSGQRAARAILEA
jgi:monoamine oxidase